MGKFLFTGTYTLDGRRNVATEGGTARAEAVSALCAALGGSVESMHFRVDHDDFVIIADMPDSVSTAAAKTIVTNTGTINAEAVPLLTPEEMDHACKITADFRPPGS
ncbi:MAG: GYD domain-containing protein [Nitriliruptorales bacterium]|nr:GYD domain-containing protein [Nitriliruptorales bacterium]